MDLLIRYAMSFVGLPYRWGGDDPMEGFDCSGLVQEILASAGMDPPGDQTAQALYDHFSKDGTPGLFAAGVLAFYGESVRKITHVGFCIDQYRMVEAGSGGSRTTNLKAAVDQNAYVRIRLINARKDLVATVKPRYFKIGVI